MKCFLFFFLGRKRILGILYILNILGSNPETKTLNPKCPSKYNISSPSEIIINHKALQCNKSHLTLYHSSTNKSISKLKHHLNFFFVCLIKYPKRQFRLNVGLLNTPRRLVKSNSLALKKAKTSL